MRCLLDMDGVLADWAGGACRLHGIANPYDDPKNHGQYRLEDLTGLPKAQFFGRMGEEFWADLDPTPDCFDIVEVAESVFGNDNVCILTSPVATHGCPEGKRRWLRRHLPRFYHSRRYLIGAAKQFCAGPYSVLVDDSDANVDLFRSDPWCGYAVLVPRPWNSGHAAAASWSPWGELRDALVACRNDEDHR